MALFNYATKEITLKIVYYGPGLCGKTTNLQYLHTVLNPETKGKLLSLSTESERTLFFDFLPIELGKIRDFSIRFQLYTVPGQVRYNATRKVVLKGADAVIFVADSQREMREQNIESFANMRENLLANNINPDEVPIVLQFNKRDLKNICSSDELNSDLNSFNYPFIEATAVNGQGVEESFKLITRLLLKHISNKHKIEIQPVSQKEEPVRTAEPTGSEITAQAERPLAEAFAPALSEIIETKDETDVFASAARTAASDGEVERTKEATDLRAAAEEPPQAVTPPFPVPGQPSDETLETISEAVSALNVKIDRVAHDITMLSSVVGELTLSLQRLSSGIIEVRKKDLDEIKRGHAETSAVLSNIDLKIEKLKEKKSWFRF